MRLLPLSAGPLSLTFDRSTAFLRYIRLGDEELVRAVFVAVRDRDWNTVPFSLDEFEVEQSASAFHIRFRANSLDRNVAFHWNGSIEGTRKGTVHYRFHGVADAPFDRNRIGLCVLHPATCAGKTCKIEHVDGTITEGAFPNSISPHQPYKNIRSISHHPRTGVTVQVSMNGDVFEMEDQRNWTDASYKTYSTPLEIPFPVHVERGTEIVQSVTIELLRSAIDVVPVAIVGQDPHLVEVDWMHPIGRPSLGFQWLNSHPPVSQSAIDRLASLGPEHLRVDVWLYQDDWKQVLAKQIDFAQSIDAKLEVAVFAQSGLESKFRECLQILQQPLPIARVLLFQTANKTTPAELATEAEKWLGKPQRAPSVVVGTNAYFAELNRERPVPLDNSQVCYSINPQVHAFDNHSLSETLEAQRATVDSAVEYFGVKVVVSPVTLKPRFNPNATSQIDLAAELEAAVDPRQWKGYGAAWTVGVFANLLTHPHVVSLTLYEACGLRGVIANDGSDFPMTQPIASMLRSQSLFSCKSSHPLQLVAVGNQEANGTRWLLLGNLSMDDLNVQYIDPGGNIRNAGVAAESVSILQIVED